MSEAKEGELMSPVISPLNGFMKTWGKQHGYAMILGTTTGGNILHADPALGLTASLLKVLNDKYRDLRAADTSKTSTSDTSRPKEEPKPLLWKIIVFSGIDPRSNRDGMASNGGNHGIQSQ